jgi:RNA polymerase sigma-70 factor (ECF subfamily)
MSSSHSSFPATRWTVINILRSGSEEQIQSALEALCRAYWHPLYCVARQRGLPAYDAQDSVQGFFETVLRRSTFSTADQCEGRLRQLLLRAFDNYCAQQWLKGNRQKRGGGIVHVAYEEFMDGTQAEARYLKCACASPNADLETIYTREWATDVLARSLHALQADYERRGWKHRYEVLKPVLLQEEKEGTLGEIAADLGMETGALRVFLHRMRGHYRDKIERELAITIDSNDPRLIREEMTELFKAFS